MISGEVDFVSLQVCASSFHPLEPWEPEAGMRRVGTESKLVLSASEFCCQDFNGRTRGLSNVRIVHQSAVKSQGVLAYQSILSWNRIISWFKGNRESVSERPLKCVKAVSRCSINVPYWIGTPFSLVSKQSSMVPLRFKRGISRFTVLPDLINPSLTKLRGRLGQV